MPFLCLVESENLFYEKSGYRLNPVYRHFCSPRSHRPAHTERHSAGQYSTRSKRTGSYVSSRLCSPAQENPVKNLRQQRSRDQAARGLCFQDPGKMANITNALKQCFCGSTRIDLKMTRPVAGRPARLFSIGWQFFILTE